MSAGTKKIAILPSGMNEQQNILTPGYASGKNWMIVDGEIFTKRPGLRPVLAQPTIDTLATTYASTSLLPPRGVLVAAEYVIGNQPRENNWEEFTNSSTGETIKVYNDNQLVYIVDGRLFVIRKVPVLYWSVSTWLPTYRLGPNPTTGALEFAVRSTSTSAETVTTLTDSTTLASLAAGLSGVSVVDVGLSKNISSAMLPMSGQLASCIVPTKGGRWESLDASKNYVYGYMPFEMPFSSPLKTGQKYRAFYTQDIAGIDGNVVACQYQDEMLFAGRGDALMSFDGYRMSVAGCNALASVSLTAPGGAPGGLGAGTYYYKVRPKTTKPSGQTTYGQAVTSSGLIPGFGKIRITYPISISDIYIEGSSYSGVAISPRRWNPLTDVNTSGTPPTSQAFLISAADYLSIKPKVGELISTPDVPAATPVTPNQYLITSIVQSGVNYIINVAANYFILPDSSIPPSVFGDFIGLREEAEIYRTTVNSGVGGAYYKVITLPMEALKYPNGYVDTLDDATLITYPQYVAKPYTIQRPPDCCVAVTQHQNRAVVIGEYISSIDAATRSPVLNTNRPLIKTLYWTTPNTEEFSPTNNAVFDVTEGGELNSLISVQDTLFVGGNESMWAVQGNLGSATTYTINRIAGAGGTVGNCAIAAVNGQVFAVSKAGLYTLVGGVADYAIGQKVNTIIRGISPALMPFVRLSALRKMPGLAVVLPGMVLERPATQPAASTDIFPASFVATEDATDTVTLIYHINTDTWSMWTGEEMYMGGGLAEFDDQVWAFPRRPGKPISVLDEDYAKDGFSTPIKMVLKGEWQDDDDTFTDKTFSNLRVISTPSAGNQNFLLRTKIERNWNSGQAWQEFDLSFSKSLGYGQQAYGVYPYGDPSETAKQIALTNQKALSVRAVFENSNPAEFPEITSWNFEVAENRKNMKQE